MLKMICRCCSKLWKSTLNGRYLLFIKDYLCRTGPGSSVGIATEYGLDGPGIESSLLAVVEREGCAVGQ